MGGAGMGGGDGGIWGGLGGSEWDLGPIRGDVGGPNVVFGGGGDGAKGGPGVNWGK